MDLQICFLYNDFLPFFLGCLRLLVMEEAARISLSSLWIPPQRIEKEEKESIYDVRF